MPSTTAPSKASKPAQKPQLMVIIRLSPDKLAAWPADVKPKDRKSSASARVDPSPSVQPPESNEKSSDSNGTPVPPTGNDENDPNSPAPPRDEGKKKRGGGAAAATSGRKRAPPAIDPNAPLRERGRPGPKKKPRLPDGTIDRTNDPNAPTVKAPVTSHKLGPKANTGAINAGLRALDRSGKPCRRWERKGLHLKSFTGTAWSMSSWRAPVRPVFSGDVKSDSTGSSEAKPNESSAVGSERSQSGADGGDVRMTNGLESSPPPAVTA